MDEVDWQWPKRKKYIKKEGINYELWRIWWSICATRTKGKIR